MGSILDNYEKVWKPGLCRSATATKIAKVDLDFDRENGKAEIENKEWQLTRAISHTALGPTLWERAVEMNLDKNIYEYTEFG